MERQVTVYVLHHPLVAWVVYPVSPPSVGFNILLTFEPLWAVLYKSRLTNHIKSRSLRWDTYIAPKGHERNVHPQMTRQVVPAIHRLLARSPVAGEAQGSVVLPSDVLEAHMVVERVRIHKHFGAHHVVHCPLATQWLSLVHCGKRVHYYSIQGKAKMVYVKLL
jgi:hypothetical protein